MHYLYAAFDTAIAGGTLLAWRIWFYAPIANLRRRIVLLSGMAFLWIILDVWSVQQGWWHYNEAYISGWYIADLPLEEIAFFVCIPIACMLTWRMLRLYVSGTLTYDMRPLLIIVFCGVVLFGVSNLDHARTVFDCVIALITIAALYYSPIIALCQFWVWNAVALGLFLVCNTLLTALPVVIYDTAAGSGGYIGTIPFEDVIYNFSLLNGMALLVRPDR
jgi:lycopene cyclase domain-containing protein